MKEGAVENHMFYVTERTGVVLWRFIERTGNDSVELGAVVTADIRELSDRESLGDPFLEPYPLPCLLYFFVFPAE